MSPQRERQGERDLQTDRDSRGRPRTSSRAGESRKRANYTRAWEPRGVSLITDCWKCGALDCRQANHAKGCPELPPVSKERMLAIAAQCWGGAGEKAAHA